MHSVRRHRKPENLGLWKDCSEVQALSLMLTTF